MPLTDHLPNSDEDQCRPEVGRPERHASPVVKLPASCCLRKAGLSWRYLEPRHCTSSAHGVRARSWQRATAHACANKLQRNAQNTDANGTSAFAQRDSWRAESAKRWIRRRLSTHRFMPLVRSRCWLAVWSWKFARAAVSVSTGRILIGEPLFVRVGRHAQQAAPSTRSNHRLNRCQPIDFKYF